MVLSSARFFICLNRICHPQEHSCKSQTDEPVLLIEKLAGSLTALGTSDAASLNYFARLIAGYSNATQAKA